LTAIYCFCS